jgi:uncharacterized membrane protein YeaQ/YmgE (transglycosylase-associated protein family)
MSILVWILLGLIVGYIASKLVNKTGEGVLMNIVLGIVGAVFGGELIYKFVVDGASGVKLSSVLVSTSGAVFFLFLYHNWQGTPSRPLN